jgi:hypothetical protein
MWRRLRRRYWNVRIVNQREAIVFLLAMASAFRQIYGLRPVTGSIETKLDGTAPNSCGSAWVKNSSIHKRSQESGAQGGRCRQKRSRPPPWRIRRPQNIPVVCGACLHSGRIQFKGSECKGLSLMEPTWPRQAHHEGRCDSTANPRAIRALRRISPRRPHRCARRAGSPISSAVPDLATYKVPIRRRSSL